MATPGTASDAKGSGSPATSMMETKSNDGKLDATESWFKDRIQLPKYKTDMWQGSHRAILRDFLVNPNTRKLVGWVNEESAQFELHSESLPSISTPPSHICYFVRQGVEEIGLHNIDSSVQFGIMHGEAMDSLMRVLGRVYMPQFVKNSAWPESVQKDFTGQLHKFMASLTETANELRGKTILYMPDEDISNPDNAAGDKDLVQRLETTVIHWTRQIKEVVNNQDMAHNTEYSGPLEEIQFWRSRKIDLSGITEQLNLPGVERIVAVLQVSKSSYLSPFEILSNSIQASAVEANDNLKFLSSLADPCKRIAGSEPKDIPEILPELLNCIRMIWSLSRFYNTEERLTGLLRKVSNEIINRCCAKISLDDIFSGDVLSSMQSLRESIQCGVDWKKIYEKTRALIKMNTADSRKHWEFDIASIFAQIDAFVQRCRDLLEVCEGQVQFTRNMGNGETLPLPSFGGTKGPEIRKNLLKNEDQFKKLIEKLRNLDYDILDVKATRWHDDYNYFKNGIKDLEVMMQNVINNSFEHISTVQSGVELLEAFHSLAKRDSIIRCVEKKTMEVYTTFSTCLADMKNDFLHHMHNAPIQSDEPKHAGSALWARGMLERATADWTILQNAHYLAKTREEIEAEAAFNSFREVIDGYIKQQYVEWMGTLTGLDATAMAKRLEAPLLVRPTILAAEKAAAEGHPIVGKVDGGLLESNFDLTILRLITEVLNWEKFGGEPPIPYVAHDITNNREKLRILREYVMLVVRDYNIIISSLEANERKLFQEHIRRLDKRINGGMNRFTWASKGVIDWYVKECRKHCADTYQVVKDFQEKKALIRKCCNRIASTLLISIEKNYVYEEGEFEQRQQKHREIVRSQMTESYKQILEGMKELYYHFKNDPQEVQKYWQYFVDSVDVKIEEALRTTVKRSLQEVSRAINGDAKTEAQPLFKVDVILDSSRVEFRPTMIHLTQTVNIISKDLITTIVVVPRILESLEQDMDDYKARRRNPEEMQSSYDSISNDDDILKILVQIMNGMSASATELQKYLSYWDKYKPLWEMDKDAFIRRYAKANRPLSQYDIDITRYKEQQQDIQQEEANTTINFIKIDCSVLKTALVKHCVEWQNKLTRLLNDNGCNELSSLQKMFQENTVELTTKPLNPDQLALKINLLADLHEKKEELEGAFEPLEQIYATLNKFDVQIPETESLLLSSLRPAWTEFVGVMEGAEGMLKTAKNNMKKTLLNSLDNYLSSAKDARKDALTNLPFGSDYSIEKAHKVLQTYEEKLKASRKRALALKPGLAIFGIDPPNPKEVRDTERELGMLQTLWGLSSDWEAKWDGWKTGRFDTLNTEQMELTAGQFFKKLSKMGREIKQISRSGQWGCWLSLKETIEQFRATLPLILDLKNPALRARHWDQLRDEINKRFDPQGDDFTLEKVFSLGLHMHAEFIGTMSSNANKELAIETALAEIKEVWKTIDIQLVEFKEIYYKVKTTEDLFAQLEDNQVALSSMKASSFYLSFEEKILYWENSLSHISEVMELLLAVQRAWMYLESIFMSSEDIRKQLPTEAGLFDQVNDSFKAVMQSTVDEPNALNSCTKEGRLETLQEMDSKLEIIQKSLDQYLETKRQFFPRFYFLSNDDLLEILGQQKDPEQVQKHIKKCFVGIHKLLLVKPGIQGNKTIEANAMIAKDGETVPFVFNVIVDGAVEGWLVDVENASYASVKKVMGGSVQAFRGKKEKWIKEWPGQMLIATGKIQWTQDCARALESVAKGNSKALRQLKKKQVGYIGRLSDMVRGQLTKIERKKVVALITMELHSRDVQERMIKANCSHNTDFEWLSQLRFYWEKDSGEDGLGEMVVKQTNCNLQYGYEYQGNNGRLVVTPLTDRCVLTLNTALFLQRGGSPLGPAGTGKTETVKDLGKNLAKYVVVFNCSDGMDYLSVGRMFSGLVQTGGWGCFDEFNRIQLEVLSVVGQQVMCIMDAIRSRQTHFVFMGVDVRCNWNCGIFITMNPGYAGRSELPDSLKALFRPVAMMVPDLALIAEVMLAAEGFREARGLAKKTTTLYALMTQQLSKQDHYDFGLRSLRGVLVCAGSLKRSDPSLSEEAILLRSLRDMNVPKFIREDSDLFKLLLNDLFPGLELPITDYGTLQMSIERELAEKKLQIHPVIITKAIQFYESKVTRHCNMLVGMTLAGKSTAWKTLANALTALAKIEKEPGRLPVKHYDLNPKSVSMGELYGCYDLSTMEWTDGILSTVFRMCATDDKPEEKWIILDGPVDTLWIESMNTVMDDNKTLTLINGDRIGMSAYMSLTFEVRDLSVASPATVSRAGMIYVDVADLGHMPYVTSWVQRMFPEEQDAEFHMKLFTKYVDPLLEFKRKRVTELVPVENFNSVISLCNLYEAYCKDEGNGLSREADPEGYWALAEKFFTFSVIWSVCAAADEKGRINFDSCLRDIENQFPPMNTVYDFYVDTKTKDWKPWDEKVQHGWKAPRGTPFFKMIVPTVDTVRNAAILQVMVDNKYNGMFVGNTGTGKTVLVEKQLEALPDTHAQLVVNFSSATNSDTTQNIIEGAMEKRSKNKFGPAGGKKLVTFIDDFNMPQKDLFGSQPPLELIRQWIDYQGWFERKKQTWRYILDMQLIVAMGPPGGGRSKISGRLQSRFHVVNCTAPSDMSLKRIYESILNPKLGEFDEEIRVMGKSITNATVDVYKHVMQNFLPTPAKCHYLFNMRDVSKVIQGVMQADKDFYDSAEVMTRLWCHEACRVFQDRFVNYDDCKAFQALLDQKLNSAFGTSWSSIMGDLDEPESGPIFVDFMGASVGDGPLPYEECTDFEGLKVFVDEKLEDYNVEPGFVPMDLVLFKDAIRHITRIYRVLKQPRGNCMLIGVGGSGRQSLTRLSSFIAEMKVFQIEITKTYRSLEFHEDMKLLYNMAGLEGKTVVFLFNDTQLKEESFLEDINNMLSSGEIPNLFPKEEIMAVYDGVRPLAKKLGISETADSLWKLFINQVRANLHIVLAMTPIGDGFRNRCRMYPALVNCTTIDYFFEWPAEALTEVALKFLDGVNVGEDKNRMKVAQLFATSHEAVADASDKMLAELKRHNYVTPTNYLELVKSYSQLLGEKRKEIGESRDKLKNGLVKLEESRIQVEEMSVELAAKKVTVAQAQKDCEELLVVIVSERRVADEQKKQVEADSERIGKEKVECEKIASDAEADLGRAMPALAKAMEEVNKLDKSSISEIKSFKTPPDAVVMVLEAVMIFFGKKTDWGTAKKKISEANFLSQIKQFDKDEVSNAKLTKVKKYTKRAEFEPEQVKSKSIAAAALCTWVCAIELYCNVFREVAPKRAKLKNAMDSLARKEATLAAATEKLAEVTAKVQKLKDQYDGSVGEKNRLRNEAEELESKLDRADKLVGGLSGERVQWETNITMFEAAMENLIGDALVAAAFASYAGPFDSIYRADLVSTWISKVKEKSIPFTDKFSFSGFLANPTDVRDWNIQGLPTDDFSTENGVIVTRGRRWALMVDPQGQANKWIKNMEGSQLLVCDLKMGDFLRKLENAIQFGMPYLMQDVLEELDPALEPVLAKSVIKIGNRAVLKLGDKELDYSQDFKFYLTTKLPNPHYTPEVSTKVTICNFAVKQQGLQAQLLGIVVKAEEPKLEEQSTQLVVRVAKGKRKIVELQNEILRLLATAEGSLLDDENLVTTLQQSKTENEEVTKQLVEAEETKIKIDAARQGYSKISVRSSILFFVLNELSSVDPMYQFSLDAYIVLFNGSIKSSRDKSGMEDDLAARIEAINSFHTLAVYEYACRGLFERHKLLLSFQMCVKTMQLEGKVNQEEYNFFLRGGLILDRSTQKPNPCPEWVNQAAWDNVTELEKLSNFTGFASSFEQTARDWRTWYMDPEPENKALPGEWENKLDDLQKMIVLRSLRSDRALFSAASFISHHMGSKFIEPPPFDLAAVHATSDARIPLIFVLSPGVDPTNEVQSMAKLLDIKMENCSLGQGQAPIATKMIEDGLVEGNWVFLVNCHLSISWMPALEKIIDGFADGEADPHPDFRLWLSSSPHPKFPIAILQRGIKMTTEPPTGLKANLLRLYNLLTEEQFERANQKSKYKALLFSLCWFHSVLLERRKFKALGWNIPYDFNNSDFSICENIVQIYLDEYPEKTPFDAIKYLVAEANYGGRVTDDWDRRLVNVYVAQFFCDDAIDTPNFPLSELAEYYIPSEGEMGSYKDYIKKLPLTDSPAAFGQHPNADIASQIMDTNSFLGTLLSLQPRLVSSGGETNEAKVLRMAEELIEKAVSPFDVHDLKSEMAARPDPEALKTCLFQECDRYNVLFTKVKQSLVALAKGIQGLVVITSELESVFDSLLLGRIPEAWSFCYPSLKSLGDWWSDLEKRYEQMDTWGKESMPKVFWLSGFTYPTGFLTALLQTSARKNGLSIDTLSWEFPVLNQEASAISQYPKEGAYVHGLFLEGARWDYEHGCLSDASPMVLISNMPVIHFKPVENKKKLSKALYTCPMYLYPIRTGTRERPSFMVSVELKAGNVPGDFWVKRGCALLLSTA
jgi:dynein heavy chain